MKTTQFALYNFQRKHEKTMNFQIYLESFHRASIIDQDFLLKYIIVLISYILRSIDRELLQVLTMQYYDPHV